jgi:hypothetical protein
MKTDLGQRIKDSLRKPDCGHVHTSYPEADIRVLSEQFAQWLDALADDQSQTPAHQRTLRYAAGKAREDAGYIRTVPFGDVT